MPTRKHRKRVVHTRRGARKDVQGLPVIQPDAAGCDVGSTAVFIAVPVDRDPKPVRMFSTFTADLLELVEWLRACRIRSIAMESTGVYWIPVFQILAAAGFEVLLVNPRHVKNVRGRKTDVVDCQWIQHLHAVGLLQGSFRPGDDICALRTLYRHRDGLVTAAAEQIQLMQKALTQMNLHLHHVLSDLAGMSGLRIVDAILAGERDPRKLAKLRESRCQTDEETLVAALTGDWRSEHVFTLKQARESFRHFHALMRDCDVEIENWMKQHPSPNPDAKAPVPAGKGKGTRVHRNQPQLPTLDLKEELFQRWGIDLTQVPSLGISTVYALYAELGPDLKAAFPSIKQFCSWLGVCPEPRKSGGKVLKNKTRDVQHRVAGIFRQAAQSVARSDDHLGRFYRRIRGKLGSPQAVTATAHKIARMFYYMVTTHQEYDDSVFAYEEKLQRERRLKQLQRQAKALGYTLAELQVS